MTLALDSEDDLPATSANPESLLIGHSDIDAVRGAIEQLPVNLREVILLCDVEDASYWQIADRLLIPIGTVMSRLARARKLVHESVGEIGADGGCWPSAKRHVGGSCVNAKRLWLGDTVHEKMVAYLHAISIEGDPRTSQPTWNSST